MLKRAVGVAGDVIRAASKAGMMNRSEAARRPPALQLPCLIDGSCRGLRGHDDSLWYISCLRILEPEDAQ